MSLPNCEHNHKVVSKTSLQIEHSSSSSTSSPSHSPLSTLQLKTTQNTKTMEEVWKDISLASLSDNTEVDLSAPSSLNPNNHNSHQNNTNFTLQDFFSRPYARDTSQPRIDSPNIMPSTPQNVLNLNSAPSFDFPDSHDTITSHGSLHFHNQNGSDVYSITSNRPHICMNSAGSGTSSNGNSVDRRQKRMLKNRESAARSRQRRQAYTIQLEQESYRLGEENKRLKEKTKELIAKAVEIPKRRPIFRTYSL